jgi:hypothetical protein
LPNARGSGIDVVDWGLALAILIGRFTGLRADSIATLQVSELGVVGKDTYAILWRHTKKADPEERLAIVPASLAALLREYDAALAPLRAAIGTDRLFVRPGQSGHWAPAAELTGAIRSFVARRIPTFAGLSISMLRRTFATRALAEGRSLAAIAAQLGHAEIRTTLNYTRFEQTVHAVETRAALDRYGRVVLERWKVPALLAEIEPSERGDLERDANRRDCGVGLCRPGACVMLAEAAPPPCLACAHLATGPDFFPAWDHEIEGRRLRVIELERAKPPFLTVAANEVAQLAEIERIYADLKLRAAR